MVRSLATTLTVLVTVSLLAASAAGAATVSGAPNAEGRLEVTYRAAPGEQNELRVLPNEAGVRFAGSVPLVPGDHCFVVRDGDVRCGPGEDVLVGGRFRDLLDGGPGRDVAYVQRRDETSGCERVVLGWPG